MGLKKNILLGWLAFEIAAIPLAIPTAAKIVQSSFPSPPTRIASVIIPSKPGTARILVAADGPFAVVAQKAYGKLITNIHISGKVNGNAFGGAAQSPGPTTSCKDSNGPSANIIYQSDRRTAPNTGPVIDQAVVVEVQYDAKTSPSFSVETLNSKAVKLAKTTPFCAL